MTLTQQKLIITSMLKQAIAKSSSSIVKRLEALNKTLQDASIDSMEKVFQSINCELATLENLDEAKPTLAFLKSKGLYRMLYRHPKYKGQEISSSSTALNKLLRYGFIGVAISALITVAFVASLLFGAPLWVSSLATGLFIGASTYLSGLLYGVVNDLLATKANLPYFLLGHQPQQDSMLRTNDKVAQGVAWGIAATFGPVIIASIVFTIAATITAFLVPTATFLMPALMLAMPLIAVGAEFYARKRAKSYAAMQNTYHPYLNKYQCYGLKIMSPTKQEMAAWMANSDRNFFAFTKVPIIGLVGLIGLVTLSSVSKFLPTVLFASPLAAVIFPAAFAVFAVVTLAIGGVYTYLNRNRQIDDRCNLDFSNEAINYDLYLDEDRNYVNKALRTTYVSKTNDRMITQQIFDHQTQKNWDEPRTLRVWSWSAGAIPRATDDCMTVVKPNVQSRRHEI